jgi:hypothetical protein
LDNGKCSGKLVQFTGHGLTRHVGSTCSFR